PGPGCVRAGGGALLGDGANAPEKGGALRLVVAQDHAADLAPALVLAGFGGAAERERQREVLVPAVLARGFHAQDVAAGGHRGAAVVAAVPGQGVAAGRARGAGDAERAGRIVAAV